MASSSYEPTLLQATAMAGSSDLILRKKRLQTELDDLRANPVPNCSIGPKGDGTQLEWLITVEGPAGTPYANGVFFFELSIPKDYPFDYPQLACLTRLYHPQVDSQQHGRVRLPVLSAQVWQSTCSLRLVCRQLVDMLSNYADGGSGEALMPDIAALIQNDLPTFERTAADWTRRFAA